MSKISKILIGVIIIAIIAIGAVVFMTREEEQTSNVENNTGVEEIENNTENDEVEDNSVSLPEIATAEDLSALVDSIYEGYEEQLPALQTQVIDTSDSDMVKYVTGLDNANDVDFVVASEPLMTSQAYSLVLVKVKQGVDANEIAKTMKEKIDNRKWICVSAEAVYSTSCKDIIFLVMTNKETAGKMLERFKNLAGKTGPEYEKFEEEIELPEDMY